MKWLIDLIAPVTRQCSDDETAQRELRDGVTHTIVLRPKP